MNQTKNLIFPVAVIVVLITACNPSKIRTTPEIVMTGTGQSAINPTIEIPQSLTPAPGEMDDTTLTPIISPTKENKNQQQIQTGEPVIIYQRIGGLAGISEEWRVYEDGLVVSLTGLTWRLDPEEVSQQIEELKAWGFFELESEYLPENTCCDRYSYIITVKYNEQEHRVETMDGYEDLPHSLWVVLQSMNAFINKLRINPDLTPQA